MKILMNLEQAQILLQLIKTVRPDSGRATLENIEVSFPKRFLLSEGKERLMMQVVRTDSYRLIVEQFELAIELDEGESLEGARARLDMDYIERDPFCVPDDKLIVGLESLIKGLKGFKMSAMQLIEVEVATDAREGSRTQGQVLLMLEPAHHDIGFTCTVPDSDVNFPNWEQLIQGPMEAPEYGPQYGVVKLDCDDAEQDEDDEGPPVSEDFATIAFPAFKPKYLADIHKLLGPTEAVRKSFKQPVLITPGVPLDDPPVSDAKRWDLKPWTFTTYSKDVGIVYLLMPVRR